MRRPPAHLVPAGVPEHHGVARCARELAAALGAEVVTEPPASGGRVHLHVTDRLLGTTPEAAAAAVRRLCRRVPTTVTLHDVPQPSDGAGFARRAAAYATVLEHAAGWVACSHHERALVAAHSGGGSGGTVIPLPVARPLPPPAMAERVPGEPPVVAILGWLYPGKGHREVLEAAAALDRPVQVVALGAVTPGHEAVAARLRVHAERLGIGFTVTGSLDDAAMTVALRHAAVGVSAHRNLSASGSINTWIAAGRRPLVRDGGYAREMAGLRPGTITLFDDEDLTSALAAALADPAATVLRHDAVTTPHVAEVAAAYSAWWGPPAGG